MLELFYSLKQEYQEYVILFKSGSFYICFDEDAIILNKLFSYKLNELKNGVKVGFPLSLIDRNRSMLESKKINYLIIDEKEIKVKKRHKSNNYNKYRDNVYRIVSINDRINNIATRLKKISNQTNFDDILTKVEKFLCE